MQVTTHHGCLLRSITEVDLYLKETIQLFSDDSAQNEQVSKKQEVEEEESQSREADDMEYWQQIKELLVEISTLTCEVDGIRCHCTHPDCPFRKDTYDTINRSATSSPCETSPVQQHRQKTNVSYGGFEPLMQSTDVEYDNMDVVPENTEPLIKRNLRPAPVRRKKNSSLVPPENDHGVSFRMRSQTLPALY